MQKYVIKFLELPPKLHEDLERLVRGGFDYVSSEHDIIVYFSSEDIRLAFMRRLPFQFWKYKEEN